MVYDSISRIIVGLDNEWLTIISLLLHNSAIFLTIVVAMVFLEERGERRMKILVTLLVVLLFATALKEVLEVPRICHEIPGKLVCPESYAFPSVHSAVAFVLAVAFLNKPNYWYHLGFALLVGFSRLYLGVHVLEEVAAGLVVAVIGFSVVDRIWRRYYEK